MEKGVGNKRSHSDFTYAGHDGLDKFHPVKVWIHHVLLSIFSERRGLLICSIILFYIYKADIPKWIRQ